MLGADPICGLRIILIEELAGEESSLDPPRIAVNENFRIARGRQHEIGRGADLLGMAELMNLREKKARVLT